MKISFLPRCQKNPRKSRTATCSQTPHASPHIVRSSFIPPASNPCHPTGTPKHAAIPNSSPRDRHHSRGSQKAGSRARLQRQGLVLFRKLFPDCAASVCAPPGIRFLRALSRPGRSGRCKVEVQPAGWLFTRLFEKNGAGLDLSNRIRSAATPNRCSIRANAFARYMVSHAMLIRQLPWPASWAGAEPARMNRRKLKPVIAVGGSQTARLVRRPGGNRQLWDRGWLKVPLLPGAERFCRDRMRPARALSTPRSPQHSLA